MRSEEIATRPRPTAALALAGALACGAPARAEAPVALRPEPGAAAERELGPGQTHSYDLSLAADRFLHVVVDQRGVDVKAVLLDPEGEALVSSDRPIDYRGPEDLLAVTERSGAYRLEVAALGSRQPPGSYEVRIAALRPAEAVDRVRAAAAGLMSRADGFRTRGEARPAIGAYRQALASWKEADDVFGQGEALKRIGQTLERLGRWREAAEHYRRAALAFQECGHGRWRALALADRGSASIRMGETDAAVELYGTALPLFRAAGDRCGEGLGHVSLGVAYRMRGEPQKALDSYRRALELFDEDMDRAYRADTLHNLGVLYGWLGRWRQASDHLHAAKRAYAELGDSRRVAFSVNQLGQLRQDLGDLQGALAAYREALELRRTTSDQRGEATTLGKLGRVWQELGEPTKAAEHYRRALGILDGMGRPRDAARILLYQGSLHGRLGRPEDALGSYRRALDLFTELGELEGTAETLLGMAGAERLRGDLEAARAKAERGLGILEAVRPEPVQQDLRISFFATVQHHYDFYVDLLMEMHRGEPAAGHGAAALEASERARARALLDVLGEAGADLRRGVDPELLERERRIQAELDYAERRRLRLVEARGGSSPEATELDEEVRDLIENLESVKGEIRRRSPGYAELTQPRPAGVDEIRQEVLDADELLLEYKLGDERSFLWAVTRDSFASFELPGRARLEDLVRVVRERLPMSRRPDARISVRRSLCALSRELLGQVAPSLEDRRLLIVPDGALAYLPFAALPLGGAPRGPGGDDDCSAAPPLVSAHESTVLPSASVLATQRRTRERRPPPAGLLAMVANPVFAPDDERVRLEPDAAPKSGATRSAAGAEPRPFRRLVHSQSEAEAILGLVEPGTSFRALGFDANKATVTGGRLADYRLIHFATHGVADDRHSGLSRLVLSLVDEEGAPRDGFLYAHEIYNLDLPAELVVLSACQTALGEHVRGEGLLGLTRAFLYAGAQRVMVSLWKVGDRSTAVLMARFYRHLLEDRLRPAEALRRAQLYMWREAAWTAPYHWAGFVLQGEPR